MVEYQETILEVQNLCGGDYQVVLFDKEKGYCIFTYPVKLENSDATPEEVIHAFKVKLYGTVTGIETEKDAQDKIIGYKQNFEREKEAFIKFAKDHPGDAQKIFMEAIYNN